MSHVVDHVDEAQLHAYLDRQLEFADPEVRRAVGQHIADCSRCSNMLKEVRLVHQQSERVLSIATPPERPAPTFTEIVKRAEKRRRSMEMQIPTDDLATSDDSRFRRLSEDDEGESFELDVLDELVASDDAEPEPDLPLIPTAEPSEPSELDALDERVTPEAATHQGDSVETRFGDDETNEPLNALDDTDTIEIQEPGQSEPGDGDAPVVAENMAVDVDAVEAEAVTDASEVRLADLAPETPDLEIESDPGTDSKIVFLSDGADELDQPESVDDASSVPTAESKDDSPFEIIRSGSAGADFDWFVADSESAHNEQVEFITNNHESVDEGAEPINGLAETPSDDIEAEGSPVPDAFIDSSVSTGDHTAGLNPAEGAPLISESRAELEESNTATPPLDEGYEKAAVASEEEIVFIESHQPIVADVEESQSAPEPNVSKNTIARAKRKRSVVPSLARAAMLLITLGATGWFARPYIVDRLGRQTAPTPLEQRPSSEIASSAPGQEQARDASRADADRAVASQARPTDASAVPSERRSAALADAAPPPAAPLAVAEPEVTDGVVTGTVRDAETGRALAFAQITVPGTELEATTNDSGRFTLLNVPPGSLEVGVRMIGYAASSKQVTLDNRKAAQADFDLRAAQIALDEIVTSGAGAQPARARAERQETDVPARESGVEMTREQAEVALGGPLVAVDGLSIRRITRSAAGSEIVVEQGGADAAAVTITIRSPGNIGPIPSLDNVAVTSDEGASVATATARYGNYQLTVVASVSQAEMESLIRRITVPPVAN